MIGKIICKINSNNIIILVNGVILKVYTFEDIVNDCSKEITFIPFITSKVNQESFLKLNMEKNKQLIIDNFEKSSYQAYGEIVGTKPLLIDCGAVELELDEDDLHPEIKISKLELGMYIYFYIDRLDIENG